MSETPIDLRGLRCPLPALKTKRALRRARPGEHVVVISDDPLAAIDVPNAAREEGCRVVSTEVEGATRRFVVEASAASLANRS